MVRGQREYCNIIWKRRCRYSDDMIKVVQRKFIKFFKHKSLVQIPLSYLEACNYLGRTRYMILDFFITHFRGQLTITDA